VPDVPWLAVAGIVIAIAPAWVAPPVPMGASR
jgi:hypothetical protein